MYMYMLGLFIEPAVVLKRKSVVKLKKKINFLKWQKNLSTNKNQMIYCNLGLMRQTDHKQTEI